MNYIGFLTVNGVFPPFLWPGGCSRITAPSSSCAGMGAIFSPLFPNVTNNFEITAKGSFSYKEIKKGGNGSL